MSSPEIRDGRAGAPVDASSPLAIVRAALAISNAPIVLIDGPSGAGKSVLADAVVTAWPCGGAELVRMDDMYPGWEGLRAAAERLPKDLLHPLRAAGHGRWQGWDWGASAPTVWHEVAGGRPLIVEGCGCLTRASAPLADLRVWLDADDDVRKQRALARDAGGYDDYWDLWQDQWQQLIDGEAPRARADIVLNGTPEATGRA